MIKKIFAVALLFSFIGTCLDARADSPASPDTNSTFRVSMDELSRLEGDNWQGRLSYLNYGSDKRSTIPVKLAVRVLNDSVLQYAIQYPGEEGHNAVEHLELSRKGTYIDGYHIINREQSDDGTLVLTTEGTGRDDNRIAQIQVIFLVSENEFSIRKNIRSENDDAFFNRNEYSFRR